MKIDNKRWFIYLFIFFMHKQSSQPNIIYDPQNDNLERLVPFKTENSYKHNKKKTLTL